MHFKLELAPATFKTMVAAIANRPQRAGKFPSPVSYHDWQLSLCACSAA